MRLKSFTVDQAIKSGATGCLGPPKGTRENIEELYAGRKRLNALDVFDLPIKDEDKIWALLWPGVLPKKLRIRMVCDCAARVMRVWRAKYPKDRRPQEAIRTTRLWLEGKATLKEVRAAASRAAAWAAESKLKLVCRAENREDRS